MPSDKRRAILWMTGLIVLLLIGLVAWSYFMGTRTLLEHAEAFSFRRMTVARLADQGDFRFFYATNRRVGDNAVDHAGDGPETGTNTDALEQRYTTEREESLKFGSFDTNVEASIGLGMLVDPSRWFMNEELRVRGIRDLEQDAFVAELREQVEASPRRSLLIVVHGFREGFPSALRKTAFLAHVLDIDTPVLLFDWPGDQGSSLRGYRRARRVASASGAELAATLKLVVDEIQPDRLWLMANSMGGQVVADAFHLLYRDADFADPDPEIENVMLTAADVDQEEFNQQFAKEMKALADNVTVYVSSNDRALLVARVLNRGRRLGESTLDPKNPGQVGQAAKLLELLESGSDRLVLVDVTPVNRTRNFHNFSLETPEFFDDLFLRFVGKELPASRELYLLQTPRGSSYFVLTRSH